MSTFQSYAKTVVVLKFSNFYMQKECYEGMMKETSGAVSSLAIEFCYTSAEYFYSCMASAYDMSCFGTYKSGHSAVEI